MQTAHLEDYSTLLIGWRRKLNSKIQRKAWEGRGRHRDQRKEGCGGVSISPEAPNLVGRNQRIMCLNP